VASSARVSRNYGKWCSGSTWDAGKEAGTECVWISARLLAETEIERIRLSSVEPMDFTDDLGLMARRADFQACARAAAVGSDSILRRMHRSMSAPLCDGIEGPPVDADAGIGADVWWISGRNRCALSGIAQFIEAMPFTYLHVFTYRSDPERPRFDADAVPMPVRKERNRVLRELAARKC